MINWTIFHAPDTENAVEYSNNDIDGLVEDGVNSVEIR